MRYLATFVLIRRHPIRALGCLFYGLFAFVMLVTRPLPAFSSLHVPVEAPHAALWNHAYQTIPFLWRSGRQIVLHEVTLEEMERIVTRMGGKMEETTGDDSIVDGCYEAGGDRESDPAIISLVDSLRGEEAEFVFTHEYGHFVWDEFLSDAQRGRYARLWRLQRRDGHLVTHYAADSEEEGFAEAFAHFIRKPGLLKLKDARSYQFLQELTAVRRAHLKNNRDPEALPA